MARGKKDLEIAKAGYREAKNRGDREEEARWANQVGHACKERGQYVEALKWFRLDYQISTKRMEANAASPPDNLMPTCQSMGEIYLRLGDFQQALLYQTKHFELAEDCNNLVEQQRASTQLGRTYLEIYESKDNLSALQNAKNYLKIAMDLVIALKENPPTRDSPSFAKELVDAYNNMGLLRMVTDDTRQAMKLFQQGLKICDEEELREDDDARSRIHHNLGRLYCEQREWDKAKQHIQMDIAICQRIPHPQGEAKGLINLGEIHFKCLSYEDATRCFERALQVAQSLEDEDCLLSTVQKNIEVVHEAEEKMRRFTALEQKLKKLQREKNTGSTTASRSYQKEEYRLLLELIGLAEELQAWEKHLQHAKSLNTVVKELGDMEKLGDALENIGTSYYNLKKFEKAKKWYLKSWDVCKRIGHVEGQTVAKINYGNSLDCSRDWDDALKAYKEAYETAKSLGNRKMLALQIDALENMHYCYFVRLERMSDARVVEEKMKRLKELKEIREKASPLEEDRCSETDSGANDVGSASDSTGNSKGEDGLQSMEHPSNGGKQRNTEVDSSDDDIPLAAFKPRKKPVSKRVPETEKSKKEKGTGSSDVSGSHVEKQRKAESIDLSQLKTSRKRPRIILSDDEEGAEEVFDVTEATAEARNQSVEDNWKGHDVQSSKAMEASAASKSNSEMVMPLRVEDLGEHTASGWEEHRHYTSATVPMIISVKVVNQIIQVNLRNPVQDTSSRTYDWLKREVARLYSCGNSGGMKPLLRHLVHQGRILPPDELIGDFLEALGSETIVEAIVDGWVTLPLAEHYQILCKLYQQTPNEGLVSRLKNEKASEDTVVASDCCLDDASAFTLLTALSEKGTFSHLNFSHNSLGNQSMKKLTEIVSASNQHNLGLLLDLHHNNFGAASLVHICESPVFVSRLEEINLSGNQLTDAAARHIAAIVGNCKSLEVLKLEACGITTRTVLKITSALGADSALVKLVIGKNNPISSFAITGLLGKLSSLPSFMELDLTEVNLDKTGAEAICQLFTKSHSISHLMLGATGMQNDGLQQVRHAFDQKPDALVKLDLSSCGINFSAGERFCEEISSFRCLLSLNFSGNELSEKGVAGLATWISGAECRLRVLILNKCSIGIPGIVTLMKALQGTMTLAKLFLDGNTKLDRMQFRHSEQCDPVQSSSSIQEKQAIQVESELQPVTPSPCGRISRIDEVGSKICDALIEEYAVADSEDESEHKTIDIYSHGSSERETLLVPLPMDFSSCPISKTWVQELRAAIAAAESLSVLDLSGNAFDPQTVNLLYSAWSSCYSRMSKARKHCEGSIVHFSVEKEVCCGRSCCESG